MVTLFLPGELCVHVTMRGQRSASSRKILRIEHFVQGRETDPQFAVAHILGGKFLQPLVGQPEHHLQQEPIHAFSVIEKLAQQGQRALRVAPTAG